MAPLFVEFGGGNGGGAMYLQRRVGANEPDNESVCLRGGLSKHLPRKHLSNLKIYQALTFSSLFMDQG